MEGAVANNTESIPILPRMQRGRIWSGENENLL
jgi:hypothetical protein